MYPKQNIYCILFYKLLLNQQVIIVLQRYTKHISFYLFRAYQGFIYLFLIKLTTVAYIFVPQ